VLGCGDSYFDFVQKNSDSLSGKILHGIQMVTSCIMSICFVTIKVSYLLLLIVFNVVKFFLH
jgi:hypothetical protein